jgi:hypothetical protein
MITLTNASSTTRIGQTEHIEAAAEATIMAEVSVEASGAAAISETTVSTEAEAEAEAEARATVDTACWLHAKRGATYATNQVAGRRSIALTNEEKHMRDLANVVNTPRLRTTRVSSAKSRALRASQVTRS